MSIHVTIPVGHYGGVIWKGPDNEQVLGPVDATLDVVNEPELSPYPLRVNVALRDGRYIVTSLEVIADVRADGDRDVWDITSDLGKRTPSASCEPVTVAGLAKVRLSRVLRTALVRHVNVSRTTATGDQVYGMGKSEELPAVYALARAVGDNPTKAVAEHFKLTQASAAQRVARARKAGQLPAVSGPGAR